MGGIATIGISILGLVDKRDGMMVGPNPPYIANIDSINLRGQDISRLHVLTIEMLPAGRALFQGVDFEVERRTHVFEVGAIPSSS